jgi:hypothetical protein
MKVPAKVYVSQLKHALKTCNLHARLFRQGIGSIESIDTSCEWIASVIKNANLDGALFDLKLPEC